MYEISILSIMTASFHRVDLTIIFLAILAIAFVFAITMVIRKDNRRIKTRVPRTAYIHIKGELNYSAKFYLSGTGRLIGTAEFDPNVQKWNKVRDPEWKHKRAGNHLRYPTRFPNLFHLRRN